MLGPQSVLGSHINPITLLLLLCVYSESDLWGGTGGICANETIFI